MQAGHSLGPLQFGEYFHIAVKTWRTARQVCADRGVSFLHRVFSHARQVRICRTAKSLRVGKGFGEIGLGKAKEFVLANAFSVPILHCQCSHVRLCGFPNRSIALSLKRLRSLPCDPRVPLNFALCGAPHHDVKDQEHCNSRDVNPPRRRGCIRVEARRVRNRKSI